MSWEEVQIGDNCQVLSAKRIFAKDYVASGIPFYRSKEIIYKAFNQFEKDEVFIKEERFNEIKNKFGAPERGDVLISSVGNRSGISYWVKEEYDFYFKDGNLIWFRNFNDKMSSRYLVYFLNSELGQAKINNMFIGAAQKALTIVGVKSIKLSLPPTQTQKRIANILSAYDDLIENNLKRIKLLEKAAQNIYKEWFVNLRFPGHENTPINQETGLPEGWKEVLAKEYFDFKRGIEVGSKNYVSEESENTIPFLRVGSLGSRDKDVFTDISLVKDRILNFEDVCVSMDGSIGLVGYGLIGAYSTGLRKIVAKSNKYGTGFIYGLLKSDEIQDTIRAYAKGSTILHASSSIEHLKFNDANEEISNQFNKVIDPIYSKLLNLNKQNQKLKAARDILLPRLMNRTIEV